MKKSLLLTCGFAAAMFAPVCANAQTENVVIEQETVTVTDVPSHDYYYSTARDNWFIQIGAGINAPFVENYLPNGGEKHHLSVAYNFAFGKWMSPYLGWRISFLGGPIHWDNGEFSKAKYASANLDFMWDMCNSIAGVNSRRPVSIIPFVGLGGTFCWDFKGNRGHGNDRAKWGVKNNQWTLPVSAGVQVRFRCSKYVDIFAEYRAQFYGDNFNNYCYGEPVDVNMSLIGGLTFNIGGCDFKKYNPADYAGYIANLNAQVNDLRGALATTAAALSACEAQLPCPEVQAAAPAAAPAPLMASVRFRINSSVITPEEQVNVYNIAEWMKANPEQKVTIVGYADKDTGTSAYNMALSKRRAQAVYDSLTKDYKVDASRLSIAAEGSDSQPYPANNDWNRIVIFNNK